FSCGDLIIPKDRNLARSFLHHYTDFILRGAIRDLIKRKENGEIFKWDKTFVETVVKPYFPELFEEIQKQMN
ncbi:MAG: hypothetical protein ACOYI6_11655, partial [Christensenellales bacterium]